MKTFITFLLFSFAIFAKAQIVNIPDSNFKFALTNMPSINTNNDGEIQATEALQATTLTIWESPDRKIFDITGIEAFVNLSFFEIHLSAPTLNISSLVNLNQFRFEGPVTTLNMNGCTKIEQIIMSGCDSLTVLDVSACTNIKEISVSYCRKLSSIRAAANDSLKYITLSYCNSFSSPDFSNLRSLQQLHIQPLTDLHSLNVNGCTSLQYLSITATSWLPPLNELDLSSCFNLAHFASNSFFINHLNLKNGSQLSTFDCYSNPSIQICADEFEIEDLRQRFLFNFMTPPFISSYCSFFPGGNYNTITGKARIDVDNNGCDNNDRVMQRVAVKIQDTSGNSVIRYTASTGDYAHYVYKGLFTLTPYFPYPYFNVTPSSSSTSFDTSNNLTSTRDFCVHPVGIYNDLEITFHPAWPPASPGRNTTYTLTYKNRGTTTLSGNTTVNFDNNKMNFVSASENVTTQSSGQLLWNYNDLQPFESRTINVTFNLLPPPVNNIGDTISYLAVVTPSDNDETAFDNIFILPQRVIGSFDPNDKQCLEGSKLDISKIGDYLHYQIRFQNEGTDTAFNIVVADTLSDKLDWNTFEFIGSSHTCDPQLKNNKAEFFFKDINLPYKAINEPASNGWVAFKIKPKPSVIIGDSLNNSAAIYFDFNLPVITNTATTIVTSSSTPVPVKLEYFSANKKDNTNQLNWKASCTYGNAVFVIERSEDGINFKAIGNINATAVRCQLPFNFTDNNPVAGKNYYRLKITDADGKSFYSKTLVV